MNNNILTVVVRNKVPSVEYGEVFVADNSEYRIRFDFDAEWEQTPIRTARFIIDDWTADYLFTGDTVRAPLIPSGSRDVEIGVYAGSIRTTSTVCIPVLDSILYRQNQLDTLDAAEIERVRQEAARVEAELQRHSAENARVNAENARVSAENARQSAESSRQSAEQSRHSAELARAQAEASRIGAENARQSAEASRQSAEQNRNSAELLRMQAENARNTAEHARLAVEAARSSAETERVSAEAQRISDETDRSSAESERVQNERIRGEYERVRVLNETARIENEAQRTGAEELRQARMTAVETVVSDFIAADEAYRVLALINEFGPAGALKVFLNTLVPDIGLTAAVERFFTAAAEWENKVYASVFYRYATSPTPVGTKTQANASLVCVPSTKFSAGRDDYAGIPLFACFDCNYTIDPTTLEPVIHAIKGVYGEFSSAPENSLVGVLQMTGWVRRSVSDTEKTVEYAAKRIGDGFLPLPEAVRASDNGVRAFVIHAKYVAGLDALGKLSSISGVFPATNRPAALGGKSISHDGQVSLWRARGGQYGGAGICDQAFLQTMLEIKYANLGSSNVMRGCCDYDLSFTAAASETGTRRILLTAEDGASLSVGSIVSVGTSNDRASADCYSLCPSASITAIETVNIAGSDFAAVSIDADVDFDTTLGETCITTHPWRTGATDAVLGNDGSPSDNLCGREPFKLQGIELMLGAHEAAMDTLIYDNGSSNPYDVHTVRRAANADAATSLGVNAYAVGTIKKSTGSAGFKYIKECSPEAASVEGYILPQSLGATSSTGYCAALQQTSGVSGKGVRQYIMFGGLSAADAAGISFIIANWGRESASPLCCCRAAGTAGNRGVYSE